MNSRPATIDDLVPGTMLCVDYEINGACREMWVICFRTGGKRLDNKPGFVTYSPDKRWDRWGWDPFEALGHYHVHE